MHFKCGGKGLQNLFVVFSISCFLYLLLSIVSVLCFSFSPCVLFLFCLVFHTFYLFCKCCILNWNIPWEDRDDSEVKTEPVLGLRKMLVPIIAGILSALRRVIARRVSIKVVTFM